MTGDQHRRVLAGRDHPYQRSDYVVAGMLFVSALCLYFITFSPKPTSDGLTEAMRIESGDPVGLFRAVKLLYQPLGYVLYQFCQGIGLTISPIQLLQIMDALAGAGTVAAFYLLLANLVADRLVSLIGAAVLAVSHSFWYYLNGEVHVFSTAFLLAASWVLLTRNLLKPGTWLAAGLLHGIAVLFHIDTIGFGGVALVLVLSSLCKGRRLRAVLLYGCSLLLVVSLPYLCAGRILAPEVLPWRYWYDVLMEQFTGNDKVTATGSFQAFVYSVGRLAKGQGTALTIGMDVVADLGRNHSEYTFAPHLLMLLGLTAGSGVVLLIVVMRAWPHRRALWRSFHRLVIFAFAWFVSLKVVNYFWVPSEEEYHVTALPPLIILLCLCLLTRDPKGRWRADRRAVFMGGLFALLVCLTNLFGIVLPWKRYGESILAASERLREISDEDALLASCDSAGSLGYFSGRQVENLKADLLEGMDVGLDRLEMVVDSTLAEGRQVFMVGWLDPPEFLLVGYNDLHQTDLTPEDFAQVFQSWAADRYLLVPVAHHWQWETRYETYGVQDAVVLQVEPAELAQ